jgi:hypothetical protein
MRTPQQIELIKSNIIDPYLVEDFISQDDVNYLVKLFESQKVEPNKVYKNTGPVTLSIKNFLDDSVVSSILEKIKKEIGDFTITAGFFFYTNYPHIIHNDDTFELPDSVYRAITLPLKLYGTGTEYPKLCMFDQFYFHGPAKFFKGETHMDTFYNKCLYEYSDVDGLLESNVPYSTLFTHLKSEWLEGLSVHSTVEWKPTNALIFDSVRLHCASDFRQLGYEAKLGISIFTKR